MESMPAPCAHPTSAGPIDPYLVGLRHPPQPVRVLPRRRRPRHLQGVGPLRGARRALPAARQGPRAPKRAPNYALIVPDTCNDGHDRGDGLLAADRRQVAGRERAHDPGVARLPAPRRADRHLRRVRGLGPAGLLRQLLGRQDRHGRGLALRDPARDRTPRRRTTTTPCCGRSRTCSACAASATPATARSRRSGGTSGRSRPSTATGTADPARRRRAPAAPPQVGGPSRR